MTKSTAAVNNGPSTFARITVGLVGFWSAVLTVVFAAAFFFYRNFWYAVYRNQTISVHTCDNQLDRLYVVVSGCFTCTYNLHFDGVHS